MKTLLLAASAALLAFPVMAATCGPREAIVARLTGKYHEVQTHAGMRDVLGLPNIVELWASPTGSWTIIQTNTAGISCVVLSGHEWGPMARRETPQGEQG